MSRRTHFFLLQALIILAPLPFGGVGRVVTPLFFIALLILSLSSLHLEADAASPRYWPWIRLAGLCLIVLGLLQVVPLPLFLVKLLSPGTIKIQRSLLPASLDLPRFMTVSLVPVETLFQLFRWLAWGLFFYSLIKMRMEKNEVRSLFHAMLASAGLQLAIALLKLVTGNKYFFLFFHRNLETDAFLTGTIGNADHFAFFLEMVFPIAIALFLAEFLFYPTGESWARRLIYVVDENRNVLLYLLSAVVIGSGIVLSGARSGIAASIVAMLVFVQLSVFIRLSTSMRRKIRWVVAGVVLLVVFIGFQDTMNKFMLIGGVTSGRLTYWQNSMRLFRNFPLFGCGFGTFKFAYFIVDSQQAGWLTHAHNDYIESLTEGGVLGLMLILFFFGLLVVSHIRTWSLRRRPDVKVLGLGVMIAGLTAAIHLSFEFALRIPVNVLFLGLLAVLGQKVINYKIGGRDVAP